jgi:thiol:disulfide interchange protein
MRNAFKPVWVVLLIFVAVGAITAFPRLVAPKEVVPWLTDFSAARAESARVHRPVFAYFTASWCGYCQAMRGTTWADPKVAAALEGYVPVKIDVDDHRELSEQFDVRGLPSFAVLDDKGNPTKFGAGPKDSEQFIGWLKGDDRQAWNERRGAEAQR